MSFLFQKFIDIDKFGDLVNFKKTNVEVKMF